MEKFRTSFPLPIGLLLLILAVLGLLAIVHGPRTYGRVLVEFTEDEVEELEKAAFGDGGDEAGQPRVAADGACAPPLNARC